MLEMGTSGLMSGEGKRVASSKVGYRALPRLYGDQLVRIEKTPLVKGRKGTARSPSRGGSGSKLSAIITSRDAYSQSEITETSVSVLLNGVNAGYRIVLSRSNPTPKRIREME